MAEVHRAVLDADGRAAEVGKGGLSWKLKAIVKPCYSPFDSAKASCAGIVCAVWEHSGIWTIKREDVRHQNLKNQEGGWGWLLLTSFPPFLPHFLSPFLYSSMAILPGALQYQARCLLLSNILTPFPPFYFGTEAHQVAQVGFEIDILLPQPSK